eukprot:TRINITY_DN29511_c0_g1_i1.p1 TRINITY_DN29511_c0_g1~~TRINITY_DN29511_c0_g1_i1.p1  ORF type:complete len:1740 (+),score=166.85 TRINITY_DN29511_c0_g1_i1:46-5265(+)
MLSGQVWDVFTDHPRDAAAYVNENVPLALMATVPLAADASSRDLELLAAVSAVLCLTDHGRERIWIQDLRDPERPARLSASFGGSLAQLLSGLQGSGDGAADPALRQAEASSPAPLAVCSGSSWTLTRAAADLPDFALCCPCEGSSAGVALSYRADLFDEGTALVLAKQAASLIERRDEWAQLSREWILQRNHGSDEQSLLADVWQGKQVPFDGGCMHQLLERCAQGQMADRIAIESFGCETPSWTYAQLDSASREVAIRLLALGTTPGCRVPLLVRRSPQLLAAIYGIMRAGHAYIPLDPEWPAERQRLVVEDVSAVALVLGKGLAIPSGCESVPTLMLSEFMSDSADLLTASYCAQSDSESQAAVSYCTLPVQMSSDMSAYILYTSGTTGKPKGVNVPHRGLVGRIEWLQHTWSLGEHDAVAQKTPVTFAISEWELFWPLSYGSKLVLASDGQHGDAQHVARLFRQHKISHSVFVPSLLDQLLEELDGSPLPTLRLIISCGEVLKATTASSCRAALPHAELVNLYGPTEGSMTMLRLPPVPSARDSLRCPIGSPIENTVVLCADGSSADLPLTPILRKGELFFGGPLIATGYWGLPELTREKFLPNPHGPGLLYRTGDLGRWRSDGTLEYMGRADNQIKFNGVRIELGEIEAAGSSLSDVRAAAAFVSGPHLVLACVLAVTNGDAPVDIEKDLKAGLRMLLPKDRLPTRLEVIESMPLTDRGKIDRRKLTSNFEDREASRARAGAGAVLSDSSAAPTTDLERQVEGIMKDLLAINTEVPMTVSFQALGFSSLLLGKFTTRLRKSCHVPDLASTAVYKYPDARQLSMHISERQAASRDLGNGGELVPHIQVWKGLSPTSFLSWTCMTIGLMLESVITEFAFLPAYYILFCIYFNCGVNALLVSLGPVFLLDQVITLALYIAVKWAVVGRRRPGNHPIYGFYYWKWWFVHTVEHYVEEHVSSHLTDTASYNYFLNLLGANIASGVRINFAHLSDVDLIRIDKNARVEREATLCPCVLWNGELQLRPIHVCAGARVAHRAYMGGGSTLQAGMELSAMSSGDVRGPHHVRPRQDSFTFNEEAEAALGRLQKWVGVPILFAVEGAAMLPTVLFMIYLWQFFTWMLLPADQVAVINAKRLLKAAKLGDEMGWGLISGTRHGYNLEQYQAVLYPFLASIPWVMTFVYGAAYFFCVVIVKWALVGRFKEGRLQNPRQRFNRWVIERLTTSNTFTQFMEIWVNSEVLSCWYRLLGARIAFRVNMDFFGAVEYDLIEVERDVVFGSSVLFVNNSSGEARKIRLRKGACVLDHCCVSSGSIVPEGTLLGSFTIVPEGHELQPMTVYTGNENGACVRLFQRPLLPSERIEGDRVVLKQVTTGEDESHRPPPMAPAAIKQRHLEALALKRHQSSIWFSLFNAWCVLNSFLFAPLPALAYWMTIIIDFEIYDYFKDSDNGEVWSVLFIPPLYLGITLSMLLIIAVLKWTIIGRWTAGDRPFYSWFHFRWAALMVAFSTLDDLKAAIAGTWFSSLYLRCMGAKVGSRVCFFGHGFEYDLLNIEDEVCIGKNCDVTAHTVENMVMRMEPVRFRKGSSCLNGSVVMPGGVMEPGSTLICQSQVLKGDAVPEGCYFGGLPAKLLGNYTGLAEAVPAGACSSAANDVLPERRPFLAHASSARELRQQATVMENSTIIPGQIELPLAGSAGDSSPSGSNLNNDFLQLASDSEMESPGHRSSRFGFIRLPKLLRFLGP